MAACLNMTELWDGASGVRAKAQFVLDKTGRIAETNALATNQRVCEPGGKMNETFFNACFGGVSGAQGLYPCLGTHPCPPTSISLRLKSLIGGKDLSEEIFDFLLVRLKPYSIVL